MMSSEFEECRFIPAGAGNTEAERDRIIHHSVYPRWRVEHRGRQMITGTTNGLSPLARGTHACFTPYVWQSRFIPAGAGNTNPLNRIYFIFAVYPRWRGEHNTGRENPETLDGLSPLARGTPLATEIPIYIPRFIPAGAGNTFLPASMRVLNSVYPRWRGEHHPLSCRGRGFDGLSPLARGTRGCFLDVRAYRRFIPAGAGNTTAFPVRHSFLPVYPRWRGEHGRGQMLTGRPTGLSPLARGTHEQVLIGKEQERFIPAGAGNTPMRSMSKVSTTVYPRWRGEHFCGRAVQRLPSGLSPLARGTLQQRLPSLT